MAVIALKCRHLRVTVVDVDSNRIDSWNDANLDNLPVYEPGLAEVVKETRGRNLFFQLMLMKLFLSQNDIVAVNTPTKTYGEGKGEAADLKFVDFALAKLLKLQLQIRLLLKNLHYQ